jgi:hypothetical protein
MLGIGFYADDPVRWTDAPPGRDGEGSRAAADIQDRLAGRDAGEVDEPAPEAVFCAAPDHPEQEVVAEGSVEDLAGGVER